LTAFLFHEKRNYILPLPVDIVEEITLFRNIPSPLQFPPPYFQHGYNDYAIKLSKLLIFMWTCVWDPYMGNSIGDPTICFIVLSCIQHDNSWAQAKDITPILARMLYILQTVFLYNIHFNSVSACVCKRHSAIKTWLDSDQNSIFYSVCSFQYMALSVAYTQLSLSQVY